MRSRRKWLNVELRTERPKHGNTVTRPFCLFMYTQRAAARASPLKYLYPSCSDYHSLTIPFTPKYLVTFVRRLMRQLKNLSSSHRPDAVDEKCLRADHVRISRFDHIEQCFFIPDTALKRRPSSSKRTVSSDKILW